MKALIILVILATLAMILFQYSRKKNLSTLFTSLATFGLILAFATLGNMTRPVMPLFIGHLVLVIISWGALIIYVFKEKYYWWLIFAPIVTLGLFYILELLAGSANEVA
jgi:ABC-type Na+ efflux pump permease subunit